jgi:hypothetical protein
MGGYLINTDGERLSQRAGGSSDKCVSVALALKSAEPAFRET